MSLSGFKVHGCTNRMRRLNYVLWIEDIVHEHRIVEDYLGISMSQAIRGIDMLVTFIVSVSLFKSLNSGTGSTAIYPLLACKRNPEWKVIGTGSSSFH